VSILLNKTLELRSRLRLRAKLIHCFETVFVSALYVKHVGYLVRMRVEEKLGAKAR
jgi:hypothetical protein